MPRKLTDDRSGSFRLASPAASGWAKAAVALSIKTVSVALSSLIGLLKWTLAGDSRRRAASQVCI